MGKFTALDGNAGAYRWSEFYRFSVASTNKKTTVMTYDPAKSGTYEADKSPYKIIFKTKLVQYETDDDSHKIVTSGKLVKIIYKNLDGDKIGEFSGLKVNWSEVDDYLRAGEDYKIDDIIFGGGHSFIGADNTELAPGQSYVEGDSLSTGWGNDKIMANGGNDFIHDNGGKDIYDGGDGNDTLSYDSWYWEPRGMTSGITANLEMGWIKGPDGFKDTIIDIEQVRGTFRKDKFIGDENDNRFMGLNGRDSFDGGDGWDYLRYDKDVSQGGHSGIRVDLTAGTIRDGFRKIDTVVNIEGVVGTEKRDIMKDNDANNYFGGRGGNDTFTFTKGNDSSRGGEGSDTFIFKGADVGDNTIHDFTQGEDKIKITSASGMGDLTITTDVEGTLIEFAAGSIFLDHITTVTADFFNF